MGRSDSHTFSEGQKSSGTFKSTRKGKEKSSEKEKTAKEKPAPRLEPQVSVILSHLINLDSFDAYFPISHEDKTEKFHLPDSNNCLYTIRS